MKTITHAQYLQLLGLREIVRQHWKMCQAARDAAVEIVGGDLHGFMDDVMFDSRELDEGLKLMEVTVEPVPDNGSAD